MRLPYPLLWTLIFVNGAVDTYIYLALKKRLHNRAWSDIQAISAIVFAVALLVLIVMPVRTTGEGVMQGLMWFLFVYISVYVPKYLYVVCDLVSLLPLIWKGTRWRWLGRAGAAIGVMIFVGLWWGALVTRFSINTERVTVTDSQLPRAFDGLTIAQISDLHLGTYGNDTAFVSKMVDHVNALHPDLIVFTGDLVNRSSEEAVPFVKPLSRLHAPLGVFSILGNHDYGDYMDWPDAQAKADNMALLKRLQKSMGWHMLNNEHTTFVNGHDSLVLIGVENIGDPPFKVYGSLRKAYPNLGDGRFKVLLTHNPAHWDDSIQNQRGANVALTLSGHTHAMQMRALGLSPAALRYRHWGGMYTDRTDHTLYVNIGMGTVGYPARFGSAYPEVTLITLRK